jgi:hypothetical protein
MIALGRSARHPSPSLDRFLRISRNKAVAPVADQILPPLQNQRGAESEIVGRMEELHPRPLQLLVVQVLRDLDRLLFEGVEAGVALARSDLVRRIALDHSTVENVEAFATASYVSRVIRRASPDRCRGE